MRWQARMLPTDVKLSLAFASTLVAALALPGCSSGASTDWGTTNADLSPLHKEGGGGHNGGDPDDDASAAEAAAGDDASADAQSDSATQADAPSTDDGAAADAGTSDASDGACPCGVVDPTQCDSLTQKCAQNPSCSSCSQLSQVCACAACDDGGSGSGCHH